MLERHDTLRSSAKFALALSVLLASRAAHAQTWSEARTTPSYAELVTTDATGEDVWPFGSEDVAGDGATFGPAEQSVDVRTAYAAVDAARLWLRAYVSSTGAPDPSLRLYWFIDADGDATTGGSAAAPDIDAEFTTDPTNGGYEHVLGLAGDGTVIDYWDYRPAQDDFAPNPGGFARAEAESGTDVDPILIGPDTRGYVSGAIELGDAELDDACDGSFFLRALSDAGNDSAVGVRAACQPADTNDNGVPDPIETIRDCDSDADCPAGGRCISGECVYTSGCVDDADCDAGEACQDGLCVATGGDPCDTSADCDGLVCVSDTCEPCGSAGTSCPSGRACGPDGRCVSGTAGGETGAEALVDPDESVQGGAFTCAVGSRSRSAAAWLALGLSALALGRRRQK